ncbi:uncharacterized protein LOC133753512 isoform X1 [Lepus europaeus]|uniref:uncharacterized protein LOC133753512 isoform X1 n=1 Tax=Lepus europaeus TaxID=9983 RepID=UPI002B47D9B2|nr:uncharacterized protein LOC133753512 isoform X1 [Lepus europaeus]
MGDFPSQCLFQVKDTGAGLDRKLDIAGAARRPHQESVFMPQQKQRSCGVSSPQEGDSAEPIPREDSGDFPSRHLILLKDTEAGLGRKQACLSQREDSGDSPNQHLIPLKNTEAGLAHPRERTLETSLTGISSRSKTQKLASSIPREDSGDFPNRHLILLKDTEAGLAHRTERTVEASQTGISSCSKTRELAWPILEKRQWRLPKLASYPAQTPFQHTGAGLGDLISMAAIPGRPRSPQEHRCSPAGTAVISVTGDLISVAAIPGGPRSPQEHRCSPAGTAVISVTGDLISMAAIPGGPRSPQEHRCSPAGTAVISVTGRIYSCCDRSRGPAVSAALRKETVLSFSHIHVGETTMDRFLLIKMHHPSGMSAKARSKVHSPRTQPFLGNHNTPKDQVWRAQARGATWINLDDMMACSRN